MPPPDKMGPGFVDHYHGKRGPYHLRARQAFQELGMFKGTTRALGIISELEDIVEIYQRQLERERKRNDNTLLKKSSSLE